MTETGPISKKRIDELKTANGRIRDFAVNSDGGALIATAAVYERPEHAGGRVWSVSATIERLGTRLAIRRLLIEPQVDASSDERGAPEPWDQTAGGELTTRFIRTIPLSTIVDRVEQMASGIDMDQVDEDRRNPPQSWMDMRMSYGQSGGHIAGGAETAAHLGEVAVPSERGRRGLSDDFIAKVAVRYVQLVDGGTSKGVRDHIAKEVGDARGRSYSEEAAKKWIHEARIRGFLSASATGRASGYPTAKLSALMDVSDTIEWGGEA